MICSPGTLLGPHDYEPSLIAKALVERLPLHLHAALLDAVVIGGGAVMVLNAFTN